MWQVNNKGEKEAGMSDGPCQLQEAFLGYLCEERIIVSVYLTSGIKLQGIISAYDPYVIFLENTMTQLVYKHAVSTIVPTKAVDLSDFQPESS